MAKQISANGYTARIEQDEYPEAPWEAEDMFGTLAHWHRRYLLGGQGAQRVGNLEWAEEARKAGYAMIPVALYDHSGLYLWEGTGPHQFDPGGWDSGQIGWYYATPEDMRRNYGVKRISAKVRERALSLLRTGLKQLSDYHGGNVYRVTITDSAGEVVECYGGVYEWDGLEDELRAELEALP
jgi:hypothetical protein